MKTNNQVILPKNTLELQDTIKKAIEHFQGSPVKNINKLNHSLAISLGFKNYNQLKAFVPDQNDSMQESPISIYIDSNRVNIGGYDIYSSVFDSEMTDYYFRDRENEIDELYRMIGEALSFGYSGNPENSSMMKKSLEFLLSLDDVYVIGNINNGNFISASKQTSQFNEICKDIISIQEEIRLKNTLSISDDDKCSDCSLCSYIPGKESGCKLAKNMGDDWPCEFDDCDYVVSCDKFIPLKNYESNLM